MKCTCRTHTIYNLISSLACRYSRKLSCRIISIRCARITDHSWRVDWIRYEPSSNTCLSPTSPVRIVGSVGGCLITGNVGRLGTRNGTRQPDRSVKTNIIRQSVINPSAVRRLGTELDGQTDKSKRTEFVCPSSARHPVRCPMAPNGA